MTDIEQPKPRPLTSKGRSTRDRIVAAASDLIFERGLDGVSLDDLLRATSTSKSQLHHYFDDKSDLVHAVIECQRDRVLARHLPHMEMLENFEDLEAWRNMVLAMQGAVECRGGCPLGSLASDLVDFDEVARDELGEAFDRWRRVITVGLARMVRSGVLRRDADVEVLALGVLASLQGGLLLAKVERGTRPLEVALDSSIDYLRSFATSGFEESE